MAKDKNSFLLYKDTIHTIRMLTDVQRGQLMLTIFEYVNDLNPEVNDPLLKIVFEPIKQQLKRDLIKYEDRKKLWIKAGKASAEARKNKRKRMSTDVNECELMSTNSTDSVSDSDSDSVSVSVSVSENNNINYNLIFEKFKEITGKQIRVFDDKAKRQLKARINDGYSYEDIIDAIESCSNDPYHIENPKYLTLEFITRADKLSKYLQYTTMSNNQKKYSNKITLKSRFGVSRDYYDIDIEEAFKNYQNDTGVELKDIYQV